MSTSFVEDQTKKKTFKTLNTQAQKQLQKEWTIVGN
jgi:hypothetical protein